MAQPTEVRRVMSSGSTLRISQNAVARNIIMATVDILGPERSLRDLHDFVALIGRTTTHPSQIALYDLLRSGHLIEDHALGAPDSLYPGTKYTVNAEHEDALGLARTDNVRIRS